MNPTDLHHDRASVLFQQRRYADAERELRAGLTQSPDHPMLHAMLAMTLSEQDRLTEASAEADRAVGAGPAEPFTHFVRGLILYKRDWHDDAMRSAEQALALDPYDARHQWLIGAIRLERRDWAGALAAADAGLTIHPEHPGCVNLRATALVQLGRRAEAAATIGGALARDPDDAHTHANQGWALLHAGDHRKAMEHFRESLRLDPTDDWARAGIVEALKAKNVLYRLMLRYFLWTSRLSPGARWGILIGGYVGYRLLLGAADKNPDLAPFVTPLLVAYIAFAVLTWIADPMFNLMLRLNKFGRHALSRQQTWAANTLGLILLSAGGLLAAGLATGLFPLTLAAGVVGLMVLPAMGCFTVPAGWPRLVMCVVTAVLFSLGSGSVAAHFAVEAAINEANARSAAAAAEGLFRIFTLGFLGSQFLHNWLATVEVRK